MLQRAILYRTQINLIMPKIADLPIYRFWSNEGYFGHERTIETSNWAKQQFVSVDNYDNLIGLLEANVKRTGHFVENLSLLRFDFSEKYNYLFSKDVCCFFLHLFIRYSYRKIEYSVAVGSPTEKWYDKYTEKYGGSIIGTLRQNHVCENGQILDTKLYEMFRDNFIYNFKKFHPYAYHEFLEAFIPVKEGTRFII